MDLQSEETSLSTDQNGSSTEQIFLREPLRLGLKGAAVGARASDSPQYSRAEKGNHPIKSEAFRKLLGMSSQLTEAEASDFAHE